MTGQTLRHLTKISDLDRTRFEALFDAAETIRNDQSNTPRHEDRIIATLFYEPSTRTRLSFESAAHRLGARVIGFADPAASSASKGESLIDTIRTVQRYADLIVLRHPAEGAAALAVKVAQVPIVNAGDGGHEHPTQTLFDLYTIRRQFGSIDGLTMGLLGDLRYGRTAHSLAKAATLFDAKLICIAPPELHMPEHLLESLRATTEVECVSDLRDVIGRLDVLYATRLQRERLDDPSADIPFMTLTPESLRGGRENLLLLHPLPRAGEISYEVDDDPRAMYFEQVANGVVMRMALLQGLFAGAVPMPLGGMSELIFVADPPWRPATETEGLQCSNASCVTNVEPRIMPRRHQARNQCAYCDHPLLHLEH